MGAVVLPSECPLGIFLNIHQDWQRLGVLWLSRSCPVLLLVHWWAQAGEAQEHTTRPRQNVSLCICQACRANARRVETWIHMHVRATEYPILRGEARNARDQPVNCFWILGVGLVGSLH